MKLGHVDCRLYEEQRRPYSRSSSRFTDMLNDYDIIHLQQMNAISHIQLDSSESSHFVMLNVNVGML